MGTGFRSPGLLLAALALLPLRGLGALGLETELGLGGAVTAGRWTRLAASWEDCPPGALLRLSRFDKAGAEVSSETFPMGAAGRIECPLPVDATSARVVVRVEAAGEILAERRFEPSARAFPGHLVLAIGMPASVERALASSLAPLEPVQAVALAPGDFPAEPLGLDAVAGIALRDTGYPLSPSQRRALLAWVASGGRAVVMGARGNPGGLAAALGLGPGEGVARLGLGSVETLAAEPSALAEAATGPFWRTKLGLEAFGSDGRISAGRMGGAATRIAAPESPLFALDAATLLGAGLWLSLLVYLLAGRTRRFVGAGLLSLGLALLALPASGRLDASRGGLAAASLRALSLPGGSLLIDISAAPRRPSWSTDPSALVPGRDLGLGLGEESPRLAAGRLELGHASAFALLSPRRADPGGAELLAFSAAPIGEDLRPTAKAGFAAGAEIALAEAGSGRWLLPSPTGWIPTPVQPPFLEADGAWLASLRAEYPAREFLVERRRAPGLGFSLAGGSLATILLVSPSLQGEALR